MKLMGKINPIAANGFSTQSSDVQRINDGKQQDRYKPEPPSVSIAR